MPVGACRPRRPLRAPRLVPPPRAVSSTLRLPGQVFSAALARRPPVRGGPFVPLRPLLLEERGLVLHVADERVHDRLGEAEYGGAEDDAGDAEGVDACDEADEHPVEVEAL